MKFTMIFMNIIVPPAAYCQSRFLEASLPSLSSREESRHGLCSPDLETKNMTKQKGDNDIMIQKNAAKNLTFLVKLLKSRHKSLLCWHWLDLGDVAKLK